MSIQFFESEMSMPGMVLPIRSVWIKENGRSILISPIDMNAATIGTVQAQGGVTDIVAPNLMHNKFVPQAVKNFPKAIVWGVEGFKEKRPDIKWDRELTKKSWPYPNILDVVEVKGAPSLNETAFLHKETKTLIVADLCFNLLNPKGWNAGIVLRMFGTYKRFAVSRLFLKYVKDKAAFRRSLDELFTWDFDRIVMSHGEVIPQDGKARLRSALQERGCL
jgi:hypothetical protein